MSSLYGRARYSYPVERICLLTLIVKDLVMSRDYEEVNYLSTCESCNTSHGYWFGNTCGYCGHVNNKKENI